MKKIFKKIAFCRRLARSGASVNGHVRIVAPHNLKFGDKIHIGTGAFIDARGGVSIGKGVIFANNVRVISYNHDFRDRTMLPYNPGLVKKPVMIEEGCWLGESVMVSPGAKIGRGVVLGMGALAVGEIESHKLAVGVPARVIRDLPKSNELYRDYQNRKTSFLRLMRLISVG